VGHVLGFGVGLRYTSDTPTGELAVKVYVREKLPVGQVAAAALVPPQVGGLPTDVEAIGEVYAAMYTQRYPRPVPCGVSISHVNLPGSGTLGCLVVLDSRKLCLLSNNHVIALENTGQIGDAIIQPGNAEPGASPDQVIGHLEDFVQIQASGNLVDAAVAWTKREWVSFRHVTYTVNPTPTRATIGMTVIKNGRTTQATVGVVTDMGVSIPVQYTPFPAGAEMRDQIVIRGINGGMFGTHGDSGSLVVTANTKQPVGLFFAVNNDSSLSFANRIESVMTALGIDRFYTEDG
jgi:hypothetical protein